MFKKKPGIGPCEKSVLELNQYASPLHTSVVGNLDAFDMED